MGKGGSAPSEQTITQNNLPEYFEPYAIRLMDRAEGESLAPYQPYGGQRMADVSADTGAAYDLTRQIAGSGIPGLDQAMGVTQNNMYAAQQMANVQPYQFGASQFQMSQANPYMGFQQTQVAPYAGFERSTFGPAGQFTEGDVQQYGGYKAAEFDPFTGFQSAEGKAQAFDFGDERQFTGEEVQKYMDPYLENVLDIQKEAAREDYDVAKAGRAAQAVGQNAFGGSRAALQEATAESDMLDRMARIEAEGRSAAYKEAATQFGADRAAQQAQRESQAQEIARVQGIGIEEARRIQESQAAEQARIQEATAGEMARVQSGEAAEFARANNLNVNEAARVQEAIAADNTRIQNANAEEFARIQQSQAAELARVQGISIDEAARVQAAQAAELARVQGISIDEAARVQAANAAERARVEQAQADENARARDQSLAALGFSSDQAKQLSGLGEMARAGDIQAAQLLEAIGSQIEGRQQTGLDMAYQDFIAQRDYPKQQLNFLSSIMRGMPVSMDTTTTNMVPYNPLQQMLGGGLGAIGLYRGLTA